MAAQGNKKFKKKSFRDYQYVNIDLIPESPKMSNSFGRLSLVTTPIGDFHDITVRALRILKETEYLVCEDTKETSKLLRFFNLKKELHLLNEHNEDEAVAECIKQLLGGVNIALVSDCGTPAFADPGLTLVNECISYNIDIDFIHGANSVLSALTISGFDISRFYFYGFLSPKKEIRIKELKSISVLPHPFILMDTPYRLKNLITDLCDVVPDRRVFLAMNLSTSYEKQLRGKPTELLVNLTEIFGEDKPKAEFIVVVDKHQKEKPEQ
jgi:16S rRNA (cytidine1402-2'-O)-methyltransferase